MQPEEQPDSYTYELRVDGEVVLSGAANDLDRSVELVDGPSTRPEALKWLRRQPSCQ